MKSVAKFTLSLAVLLTTITLCGKSVNDFVPENYVYALVIDMQHSVDAAEKGFLPNFNPENKDNENQKHFKKVLTTATGIEKKPWSLIEFGIPQEDFLKKAKDEAKNYGESKTPLGVIYWKDAETKDNGIVLLDESVVVTGDDASLNEYLVESVNGLTNPFENGLKTDGAIFYFAANIEKLPIVKEPVIALLQQKTKSATGALHVMEDGEFQMEFKIVCRSKESAESLKIQLHSLLTMGAMLISQENFELAQELQKVFSVDSAGDLVDLKIKLPQSTFEKLRTATDNGRLFKRM